MPGGLAIALGRPSWRGEPGMEKMRRCWETGRDCASRAQWRGEDLQGVASGGDDGDEQGAAVQASGGGDAGGVGPRILAAEKIVQNSNSEGPPHGKRVKPYFRKLA